MVCCVTHKTYKNEKTIRISTIIPFLIVVCIRTGKVNVYLHPTNNTQPNIAPQQADSNHFLFTSTNTNTTIEFFLTITKATKKPLHHIPVMFCAAYN